MKTIAGILTLALLSGVMASAEDENIVAKAYPTGQEKRVDNPVDAWVTAVSGPAGKAVSGVTFRDGVKTGYRAFMANYELLDATDAKAGQFSVTFTVDKPDLSAVAGSEAKAKEEAQSAFGFYPGEYVSNWVVTPEYTLHVWLKATAATPVADWTLTLYDTAGKRADSPLPKMAADGNWREFEMSLKKLKAEAGFNFAAINAIQVEAALPKGAQLWIDDVTFVDGKNVLGITDKTITQHMAEAESTRLKRKHLTLSAANGNPCGQFISELYNGHSRDKTDLVDTHAAMLKNVAKETARWEGWDLWVGNAINWRLYGFGSMGKIKPGMLSSEVEKETMEFWWQHCLLKNDIATARRSVWNVTGSENHDINFKTENLLSSQLFKNHPDFAKRIYPDLGRMAGYGYGDAPNFNAIGDIPTTKLGNGNYKDGKKYNAEDHYIAWVKFWKEFIRERAKRGFFIEHNANSYMYHTNRMIHDIFAWCEDEELRVQVRMWMDLIWAQWAQDQNLLIQGGSGTRGNPGAGRQAEMAWYFLGGPAKRGYFYTLSDYQWPRQVWEMMLDRPGMGEFAFISRKPNEARDTEPREPGTEYTMLVNPDSRLKRYSWVTPDYVMGLRMDRPNALFCHLSLGGEGITFPTTPDSTILFGGLNQLSVQDRNVALMINKRVPAMRSPSWFPIPGPWPEKVFISRVLFGAGVDRIVEKDGWVFAEEGNAYVAIRMIAPVSETAKTEEEKAKGSMNGAVTTVYDKDGFGIYQPALKPYAFSEGEGKRRGKKIMEALEVCTPVIVEAARRKDYATLEAFQKDILDNPIILKQMIGGKFTLEYKGCGKDAKTLYLNCGSQETPMIDGKYIDYNCPAFDSPYVQGDFGSGVVTLTGPISGEKLVLDFNEIERK